MASNPHEKTNQAAQVQFGGRTRCHCDTGKRLPARDSHFLRLRRVIGLGIRTVAKRTVAIMSINNKSRCTDGVAPALHDGTETMSLLSFISPELMTSTAPVSSQISPTEDNSSSMESSSCHQQDKKPQNAMTSMKVPYSPSPSAPPNLSPAIRSVAYAEGNRPPQRSARCHALGSSVEYIREDDLGVGGCFDALGALARDLVGHVKDVLRGPPDQYADLRSRRPIEVKVTVQYTVTVAHKRI